MSSLMHSPLLWLTVTLTCYQAGFWLHRQLREPLWFPPMLIALCLLIGGLVASIGYTPFFVCLGVFDLIGAAILWTVVREQRHA